MVELTKKRLNRSRILRLQRGGVSVEYCVATLAVLGALFFPLGGEDSLSAVGYLLQGLRNFQMNTTYLLSMP